VEPQLASLHEQLRLLRDHLQTEEDSSNSKILRVQDSVHQFDNIDREIRSYRSQGGDLRLATAKSAVSDLERQIEELDNEIMDLSLAISDAEANVANMRQLERNVADNLRYRGMAAEIAKMRTQIMEMEKQNAEAEVDNYKDRTEKLRKAHNRYTAEVTSREEVTDGKQATMAGEIKQMDLQLQKYQEQIRSEYKDAHEKYRRQNIKVKVPPPTERLLK
jgi:DNA repair protein RAD50